MRIEADRILIEVGDLAFGALASGPEDGELILMLHGFPQTSYSYRKQIPVLADRGFRVIAPDQRGYSAGARPTGVEEYAIPRLVEDVAGMADACGRETFHLVGHDWGAAVAWFAALAYPERVASLVAVSMPHPHALVEALESGTGEQARMSGYMEAFRREGAEEMFLADDAAILRGIFDGAGLSEDDVQVYVDVLGTPEAIGAALNWYRAMNLGVSPGSPAIASTPIRMPTTYVWGTGDIALGREAAEATSKYVEGPYRFEILEGIGHWVPEEASESLNEVLRAHFAP
jgi:pimeloyl-ACP methyl ester carboxylesterase